MEPSTCSFGWDVEGEVADALDFLDRKALFALGNTLLQEFEPPPRARRRTPRPPKTGDRIGTNSHASSNSELNAERQFFGTATTEPPPWVSEVKSVKSVKSPPLSTSSKSGTPSLGFGVKPKPPDREGVTTEKCPLSQRGAVKPEPSSPRMGSD
eukprot:RCo047566